VPAALQSTVHDSDLQGHLEKLPLPTQAMRLKILNLLAEGSGGMLVNK